MAEKVFRLGGDERLLGILGEPEGPCAADELPAVLFLNAGFLHRAGPFGWYVTLARRLNALGFSTLRFDLSGIGDSFPRPESMSQEEKGILDIREAMDFLHARKSIRRFVLLGLCWGALHAHHAAVSDPRVAGAVFLDGYGYRTPGFYLRHYTARLFRIKPWLGWCRRQFARLLPRPAPHQDSLADWYLDFPPRSRIQEELQTLLRREVDLLFLYTAGLATEYFNHQRQFHEMFPKLDLADPHLQVFYDDKADHLYTSSLTRLRMFERVENWLERFGQADGPTAKMSRPTPAIAR